MDIIDMNQMLHDLYCGMVCRKLKDAGLVPFLDCDPYEFATSLDMSFEEIKAEPLDTWEAIVDADLEAFTKDLK